MIRREFITLLGGAAAAWPVGTLEGIGSVGIVPAPAWAARNLGLSVPATLLARADEVIE